MTKTKNPSWTIRESSKTQQWALRSPNAKTMKSPGSSGKKARPTTAGLSSSNKKRQTTMSGGFDDPPFSTFRSTLDKFGGTDERSSYIKPTDGPGPG